MTTAVVALRMAAALPMPDRRRMEARPAAAVPIVVAAALPIPNRAQTLLPAAAPMAATPAAPP